LTRGHLRKSPRNDETNGKLNLENLRKMGKCRGKEWGKESETEWNEQRRPRSGNEKLTLGK
jgi:hypothetical protein